MKELSSRALLEFLHSLARHVVMMAHHCNRRELAESRPHRALARQDLPTSNRGILKKVNDTNAVAKLIHAVITLPRSRIQVVTEVYSSRQHHTPHHPSTHDVLQYGPPHSR
jgi:hypothetical protein